MSSSLAVRRRGRVEDNSGRLEAELCTDSDQPEGLGEASRRDQARSPLREEVVLDGIRGRHGCGAVSVALSAVGRVREGRQVSDAVRPPSIPARCGEGSV